MKYEGTAEESADTTIRYDTTTVRLHWITAALVIALWCAGETIDGFPRGGARTAVRSLHILFGVLLGVVLCARIGWRARRGSRLLATGNALMRRISGTTHFALYALLIATIVLGVANASIRGDTIFGMFSVPSFAPDNRDLRRQIEDLHSLAANTLVILAGIHALAGLWHHYVLKDGVLRRMFPAR
jgi:cytochrome b561